MLSLTSVTPLYAVKGLPDFKIRALAAGDGRLTDHVHLQGMNTLPRKPQRNLLDITWVLHPSSYSLSLQKNGNSVGASPQLLSDCRFINHAQKSFMADYVIACLQIYKT